MKAIHTESRKITNVILFVRADLTLSLSLFLYLPLSLVVRVGVWVCEYDCAGRRIIIRIFIVSLCRVIQAFNNRHTDSYIAPLGHCFFCCCFVRCRYRHEIISCIVFAIVAFEYMYFESCSWGFLSTEHSSWKP